MTTASALAARSGAGKVRAGVAQALRQYLERQARLSFAPLARAAGIDPAMIDRAYGWIDQAAWIALLEAAAGAAGDPLLGIRIASALSWRDLGVIGYVVMHSPTFRAALDNGARDLATQQTGGVLQLAVGPRVAHYTYRIIDPRIDAYGQNAEATLALVVRIARELTGAPAWAPTRVQFQHQGPGRVRAHEAFFAAPVQFGQRSNTISLPSADLARPLASADPGLLPILLGEANARLSSTPAPRGPVDEVRAAIRAGLAAGDPGVGAAAARLGTSVRSLQRRLEASGHAFRDVVEDTRRAMAADYLADRSLSLTEVAFLLGYSDLSAFSRAYRRWNGTSARAARRRRPA